MVSKRCRLFFLGLLIALGLMSGCSGGGGGGGGVDAVSGQDVKTPMLNATITAPMAVDAMQVVCGILSKSTVSGTRASITINKNIPEEFITVENGQGPVLAVMAKGNSGSDILISPRSTAEALVRVHPFLIRLPADAVVPIVQSSAAVATLATAIENGMKGNPNFIISQAPAFTDPYMAALTAVIDSVVANEKAGAIPAAATAQTPFIKKVSPATAALGTKSGVQVDQTRLTDQPFSAFQLALTNSLPRYAVAYLDAPGSKGLEKKTLGPVGLSVPTDWIPRAALSWVTDLYPQAVLRVYGPSFNVVAHAAAMAVDPDFQSRMSPPTLVMLTNEFIVPWVQAVAGVDMASTVSFANALSAKAMADPEFIQGLNVCLANGNYVSILGYLQYFIAHMQSAETTLLLEEAFPGIRSVESAAEVFLGRFKVFGSPLFAGSSAIHTVPGMAALYTANPVESWQLSNEPSPLNLTVDSIRNLTVDLRACGDFLMYEWFFGTDPATTAPDVIEFKNRTAESMTATISQESHTFPKEGLYTVTVIGTDIDGAKTGQAVRILFRSIDHIVVTSDRTSVGTGGSVGLTAKAYDASSPPQEIASVPLDYVWEVTSGTGSIDANGYFTAGSTTGEVTVSARHKQAVNVPSGTARITVTGSTIFVSTNVFADGTKEDGISVTIGSMGTIIDRPGTPAEAAITAHTGDILSVTVVYNGTLTQEQYSAQLPLELVRFYTADQHVTGGAPFARFSEKVAAGLNRFTYSIIVP